jgi:AcrR family transcriptional regulator
MTTEGDQTRARLLREARDLYLEDGFGRFSLREVARRAEVSAAAVYRHFENKEALLGEVCQAGLQVFYGYLVRALSAPTPLERLGATSTQYLRFGLENSRDYRVLFMGGAQEFQSAATARQQGPHPTFQFLVDRIRECMAGGVLKVGEAQEVATVVWAHAHGLVSLRLAGQLERVGDDAAFAGLYHRAMQQLVEGLA